MARGGKKDAAADERLRLKKLAFSTNILSQNPAKLPSSAALAPSKMVMKHHGKDILRKSQRKNRYLFSFPGLLDPISGGKIGQLKDLGTKNPILYLDFPQGQLKLFGTIVYPKNRYLTLQFSRGGKNVICDDYFDNMIVFSEAWWIGTKDENPKELQLQFPKELHKDNHADYDFKGGIGATNNSKKDSGKPAMKSLEQDSPKAYTENDLTGCPNDNKELSEVTPCRQSARTAGKTFKFAESSSGDDFIGSGDDTPDEENGKADNNTTRTYSSTENFCPLVFEVHNNDNAKQDPASRQYQHTGKANDHSDNDYRSLVQTKLSSLFKKMEGKKVKNDMKKNSNTSEDPKRMKAGKKIEGRKSGTVIKEQRNQDTVEDNTTEEFSSTSQDMDASDEDYIA